jgi:plastocyanin
VPQTPACRPVAEAAAGHPDPGWDFEPDKVTIEKGTPLIVVNQGGEPHTFTEVANLGADT